MGKSREKVLTAPPPAEKDGGVAHVESRIDAVAVKKSISGPENAPADADLIIPDDIARVVNGKLHSGAHDASVFLYGFDLIELDGEDLRPAPLEQRKGKLEKLLARGDGIRFSEHLDGDGPTIFAHACRLGLEGIVSKRRDLPYRSGRAKCWIKIKNPASPAVLRIGTRM